MKGGIERQRDLITKAYRSDVARLRGHWPLTSVTLRDALNGSLTIRLADGGTHKLDPEHVERASQVIPQVMWGLVSLPILLRYERDSSGRAWYVVLGDSWQKRAVGLLARGELTADGLERLEVRDAVKLLRDYRSLIFVSLRL